MLPRRLRRLPRSTPAGGAVVLEARTLRSRLLGLALLRSIPSGHALLVPDCRSVHTFGMRFALDIAFLDERGRTIRVDRGVGRRRVRLCRPAFAVLEARAGEIDLVLGREAATTEPSSGHRR